MQLNTIGMQLEVNNLSQIKDYGRGLIDQTKLLEIANYDIFVITP